MLIRYFAVLLAGCNTAVCSLFGPHGVCVVRDLWLLSLASSSEQTSTLMCHVWSRTSTVACCASIPQCTTGRCQPCGAVTVYTNLRSSGPAQAALACWNVSRQRTWMWWDWTGRWTWQTRANESDTSGQCRRAALSPLPFGLQRKR
jgi:hypothetical protein